MTINYGLLIAYFANTGYLGPELPYMYLSAIAWTIVYDTIYAHQDKHDDIKIGVKSSALAFGNNTKKILVSLISL